MSPTTNRGCCIYAVAGEVKNVQHAMQVTWTIPAFSSLGKTLLYVSKFFYFGNKQQCFMIGICDHTLGREYVRVFPPLDKSFECEAGIECEVSFKWADGSVGTLEEKYRFTRDVELQTGVATEHFFQRQEILRRLAPSDTLTLVLTLRRGSPLGMESPASSRTLTELEKLSEDFRDLWTDKNSCDATLVVRGKEFQVHKIVLSTRCPVFAATFRHDMAEKETGSVDIPDCDEGTFGTFLEYLYTGKVKDVTFSSALELYRTAHKYDVLELRPFCVDHLVRNLTVDNVTFAAILADQYDEGELASAVQDFFNGHFGQIIVTKEWESLNKRDFRLANKLTMGFSSYVSKKT